MAPIKSNSPFASYFDFFSKTGKDAVSPVPPPPFSASGGTKTTSGDYTIHTFTTSTPAPESKLIIASGESNISYLVIGGGGSGGSLGGGGGAGLIKYKSAEPLTPGTYPVTVGAGGAQKAAHPSPPNYGNSGGDSTFALSTPVVATGGGGGGGEGQPGRAGGSAGGDGNNAPTTSVDALGASGHPGSADVESPPAGWGNNGGRVADHPDGYSGGGGGGAGSVGTDGIKGGGAGQPGGNGVAYTISGSSVTYAGGGGGGGYGGAAGNGGPGGGGAGGGPSPRNGAAASANTGSGGGGGGYPAYGSGGAGGSGIIIIRYLT